MVATTQEVDEKRHSYVKKKCAWRVSVRSPLETQTNVYKHERAGDLGRETSTQAHGGCLTHTGTNTAVSQPTLHTTGGEPQTHHENAKRPLGRDDARAAA